MRTMNIKIENKEQIELLSIVANYDETIRMISKHIKVIRVSEKVFSKETDKEMITFFNSVLFLGLNQIDFIMLLKYLEVSLKVNNVLESNLFARMTSLAAYEYLQTFSGLSGKEFKVILEKICANNQNLIDEFNELKSFFSGLKNQYDKKLKQIRVNTIGHRNRNAYQQANAIAEINSNEIYKFGALIAKKNFKVIEVFDKILEVMAPKK